MQQQFEPETEVRHEADTVDELRSEIAALRAELAELRDEQRATREVLAGRSRPTSHAADLIVASAGEVESSVDVEPVLQVTSRRRLFALAAGGAAAAAALVTASSSAPAAANNGDPVLIANNAVASTGKIVGTFLNYAASTSNSDVRNMFVVGDESQAYSPTKPAAVSGYAGRLVDVGVSGISARASGNGVFGWATHPSSATAYGVYGVSNAGPALVGDSAAGLDLFARGTGRVLLKQYIATGPPTTGTFAAGEIIRDGTPDLWICTAAGPPATWKRIASADDIAATNAQVAALAAQVSGGAHSPSLLLVTPTRVYDSRLATQGPGNAGGVIVSGSERVVNVANGIDVGSGATTAANLVPVGATGIVCNLTIAGAAAGGFLALSPGDAAALTASTINWSPGITELANGATVKLDGQRQVKVFAGGGGSAHFIIDVAGYFI